MAEPREAQQPLPAGRMPPVVNGAVKLTGLRRVWRALFHSLDGVAAALRHEAAFRQEAVLAAILIPVALLAPASGVGKALMIASVLLVLIVELINSAIESAVDRASLEPHPLAKRAKDMASAAVLVALVAVPIVWLLVVFG
ncbi:MAG TPA: diacylglycerol kinase [Burkholderiales bacterium]|jgi:diacylglycerol kinase (ATP)|nr:diacylglycerol kinase [Burkholderiales bacterium]